MHLYAINLSIITIISSLVMFEPIPSFFRGNGKANLSHKSSKFSERKMIFNQDASVALLL